MIDNNEPISSKSIELYSILEKISCDNTYEEGKNKLIEYFNNNITNEKIINEFLKEINNVIILKGNSEQKIISIIPEICKLNKNLFLDNLNIIFSIFQNCFNRDENSQFFSLISQSFGDMTQILLNELNVYGENSNIEKKKIDENLLLTYNKLKNFCISNMKSDNINYQIYGTLCLTSFIENCSYNYLNKENLKYIFDNLCERINNVKFVAKLEILNCFISLIFCSEEKYLPYAKNTLDIIMKFINNKEWLIRKFSLNIIYTMLFYCKSGIIEKKDYIIKCFKILKNEKNSEINDMIEQINIILKEDESNNDNINNKNEYSSDSLLVTSENLKPRCESKNKYDIFNIKNKSIKKNVEFNPNSDEDEDNYEQIIKTSREPPRALIKYKNNFIKNEKKIVKPISNHRKDLAKSNNINNMNTDFKQKDFSNNKKLNKEKKSVNDIIQKLKMKNHSVEKSRNTLDKDFIRSKKKPMTMGLMKNENLSIEKKLENKNKGYNSSEKSRKILKLNKKENNIKSTKKIHIKKSYENKNARLIIRRNENKIRKNINSSIDSNNKIHIYNNNITKIKVIKKVFEKKNNRSIENHIFDNKKPKDNEKNKKLNQKKKIMSLDIKNKYYKNKIKKHNENNLKCSQFENKYIKNIKSALMNLKNTSKDKSYMKNNEIQTHNITSMSNNKNITINNNVISITDEICSNKETSNSIENKFNEYKIETNKIINELKSQVNLLKTTLYNFEESEKIKKDLMSSVKNKNFTKAFHLAINIGNIQEVYYVIKNYILNKDEIILSSKTLSNIMKILCKDILLCENLRLIAVFIINNIVNKNILFDKDLNLEIYNTFLELYNQRKELCFLKKDVTNILKIINFFKN